MRRADRLIQIMHYLRRMRHAVTAQRIADEFGICQRTVYRDIQDLMNSGVPIYGEAGVGYIIDKKYHLPPVMFDPDELEAIALGISMVRTWTDERFAKKAVSALQKVQAVLPDNLLNDMQQLATSSEHSMAKIPWEVDFSEVRDCIRNKQTILFDYTDLKDRISRRSVRPLALTFFGPVWLLLAWCEDRRDFRNFRLDRIRNMAQTGGIFPSDKDKSLSAYLQKDRDSAET